MKLAWCSLLVLVGTTACLDDGDGGGGTTTATGTGATVFTAGEDPTNAFFTSLGTNERTCATCHDQAAGWSMTPASLVTKFDATEGLDPIFRPNDGATSPTADVSTLAARRTAYRMLLTKGLIRVGIAIPAGAEFRLAAVDDPYHFASASELSMFRRPLPSTNLRFLTQIMWDTRETTLAAQAKDATTGHAQAMGVVTDQIDECVAFESSLYTALSIDNVAGDLASDGARGGPQALVDTVSPSNQQGFSLYQSWSTTGVAADVAARRDSIRRGEVVFNQERLRITGVAGIPDQRGSCSTCHDARDVGSHSTALALDLGISDANRRSDDLPLYTFTNNVTGQSVRSSDPGVALITGRWADLGKFKVPSLRGLAMRAPYFHNGRARNIDEVLDFYRQRFDFDPSGQDRRDLEAFLSAL